MNAQRRLKYRCKTEGEKGRPKVLSFYFSGTDFFPVKIATRLLKRR